jgi:hypothetical protein
MEYPAGNVSWQERISGQVYVLCGEFKLKLDVRGYRTKEKGTQLTK